MSGYNSLFYGVLYILLFFKGGVLVLYTAVNLFKSVKYCLSINIFNSFNFFFNICHGWNSRFTAENIKIIKKVFFCFLFLIGFSFKFCTVNLVHVFNLIVTLIVTLTSIKYVYQANNKLTNWTGCRIENIIKKK